MIQTLLVGIFALVTVAPIFLGVLMLTLAKKRDQKRVNPLTKSLRRPPGGHLSRQLFGLNFDLAATLTFISLSFLLPVSIHLFQSLVFQRPESPLRFVILGLMVISILAYALRKLAKLREEIRDKRLGYECELAVGQELDQLMRSGFHVFHDIPGGDFNIDHVVVGSKGVFAVETKGRSKRLGTAPDNKADYNVEYVDGILKFPGWQESEPIDQARRNAQWVSDWLSGATGFNVRAQGIVVLPGWYIHSTPNYSIPVLAVGGIPKYLGKFEVQKLSEQQVQQIVYQAEQKTRDIAPGEALRPA